MRKWIICVLSLLLATGCKTVQRVDKSVLDTKSEANTAFVSNTNTNIAETINNDKTRTITITEYVTVYDTISKQFPVKSVTEIHERDNSKSVREDHSQRGDSVSMVATEESHTQRDSVSMVATEESHTQNDLTETEKDESGTGWRLFAFGVVVGVALMVLVRLAWRYLKSQLSFGLWR